MNIKSLKIISLISILLLVLNACAKPNIKTNKKFKHNTPLIKDDIRKSGKLEIEKTVNKWSGHMEVCCSSAKRKGDCAGSFALWNSSDKYI